MPSKFERERSQVVLLMRRLELAPTEYQNPQAGEHTRCGRDRNDRRPTRGDSVTDLDIGGKRALRPLGVSPRSRIQTTKGADDGALSNS
jgi:hypothetical protein